MREKKVPLKELFKNGDSLIFQPIDCDSPKTITEFKKVRKEQKKNNRLFETKTKMG